MIYLDTAALLKLVRREVESDALVDWIASRPDELLVSPPRTTWGCQSWHLPPDHRLVRRVSGSAG